MSWVCKKCKGKKFKEIQKEETVTTGIKFDKDGYKTMDIGDEESNSIVEEYLECSSCENTSSIFNLIEDIAYWKREIERVVWEWKVIKQKHKSNYRYYLKEVY